ncbi:hypothetical protein [Rickettsiella massiliensis]|uniref:hypothetical protein n=1 Tax=Rickettsiella massiliensis TaxID=676517 RepID=UPI0012EAA4BD|nr:hypothetical protein [Rickettsiella massiliensis]
MPNFFYQLLPFLRCINPYSRLISRRRRHSSGISVQEFAGTTCSPINNTISLPPPEQQPVFTRINTQPRSTPSPRSQQYIDDSLARFFSPNPNGSPRIPYAQVCPSARLNRPENMESGLGDSLKLGA